ncbi:MAG: DUF6273 domain-containing protein [Candidatus Ancillula sp.]|jgi:hypothetical protein|nr:DUF6273 domain-containing protein [Candidatus Ancillula sp.]
MRKTKRIGFQLVCALLIVGLVHTVFFKGSLSTGEENYFGEDQCNSYNSLNAVNSGYYASSKVEFAGYNWDTIGYNNDETAGIYGPKDTVTLLLDVTSYTFLDVVAKYEDITKNLDNLFAHLKLEDAEKIVKEPRTNKPFWLLNADSASMLKKSIRAYANSWWLSSSTGHKMLKDGEINFNGTEENEVNALRPALYIKTDAFIKDVVKVSASTANIMENLVVGACSSVKQIQLGGYLWDVVSYNDGVQHGMISTPKSSAILLLASQSAAKFMNGEQVQFGDNNNYYNSQAQAELENLHTQFSKLEPEVEIIQRSFGESKITDDGSIAGPNVTGAYFWILSTDEVEKLENHLRIYPYSWWLRSPGISGHYAAQVFSTGLVDKNGWISKYKNALRPAFCVKLTSRIKNAIDEEYFP